MRDFCPATLLAVRKSSTPPPPAAPVLALPRKQLHHHVLILWDGTGFVFNSPVNYWDYLGRDPMNAGTALAEAAAFEAPAVLESQALMQQAAREGAQILAREAAKRAAAAAAAAAATGALTGDTKPSCPSCADNPSPEPKAPAVIVGPHAPSRQYTPAEEAQQFQERKVYHKTCDAPAPSDLKGCDLLRWLLKRAQGCLQLRQEYVDKWNDTYPGHQQQINLRKIEIEKLKARIAKECEPCPTK